MLGAGLLLVLVITLILYWPGVHGGYVMDDYPNIVENHSLVMPDLSANSLNRAMFSSHAGPLGRPLSMLSFALNEYIWGSAPYSMKVTNIIIHACNGVLVYALVALLLTAYRRRYRPNLSAERIHWMTLAVTVAWLLLPINVTSVLYIVQRMTSLSATFVLGGIALYVWGRLGMLAGRRAFWSMCIGFSICGVLGVLAKESAALLPIYTLIIEWTLFGFRDRDGRADARIYAFYIVVLIIPAVLGLLWLLPAQLSGSNPMARPFTLAQRLLTEPRVVLGYIAWVLLPSLGTLSLYHDDYSFSRSLIDPPITLVAILAVAAVLIIAIWQRRKYPLMSLGILWFFGGQLLTATVFNLELVYEHRNYLPSIGLIIAVFSFLLLEFDPRRLRLARNGLVVGMVSLYGVLTMLRVQQWSDPVRYAVVAAAEHPNSARATYSLGQIYAMLVDGPNSRFLPLANKALVKSAAGADTSILSDQGLLVLNASQHQPLEPAWWDNMQHKLARRAASTDDVRALSAMVQCALARKCQFPKKNMVTILETALTKNPGNANIHTLFSNYALNVLGDYSAARTHALDAIHLAPKTPQYRINLIKIDIFLRRFRDAESEIEQLRALGRDQNIDLQVHEMRTQLAEAESGGNRRPSAPISESRSPATVPSNSAGKR